MKGINGRISAQETTIITHHIILITQTFRYLDHLRPRHLRPLHLRFRMRLKRSLLRLLLLLERNVFLVQILLVLLRSLEYCSDRLKEHL